MTYVWYTGESFYSTYTVWKVQKSSFWRILSPFSNAAAEAIWVQCAVWACQIHSDKHQCRVGMSWPSVIFSFKSWSSHQDSVINIVHDVGYSMCTSVFPLLFLLSLGPAEECLGTDRNREEEEQIKQELPLLAVPLSSFILPSGSCGRRCSRPRASLKWH